MQLDCNILMCCWLQRVKTLLKPASDWGPGVPEHRETYKNRQNKLNTHCVPLTTCKPTPIYKGEKDPMILNQSNGAV